MNNKQPSGISFTLPENDTPSIEILADGTFKVNGRTVGRDADVFHAAIKFFGAVEAWKEVAKEGFPEVDEPVWYYIEDLGVSYGKYLGEGVYTGMRGFKYSNVTHWMPAPAAPERYMPEEEPEFEDGPEFEGWEERSNGKNITK